MLGIVNAPLIPGSVAMFCSCRATEYSPSQQGCNAAVTV
jgi:hypothetical protein